MINVVHKEVVSVKWAPNSQALGFLWFPWAPKGIGPVHGLKVRQGLSVCFQMFLRGSQAAWRVSVTVRMTTARACAKRHS